MALPAGRVPRTSRCFSSLLRGFKDVIDATDWLVVKLTHTLGDNGLTTRLELETRAADKTAGNQ